MKDQFALSSAIRVKLAADEATMYQRNEYLNQWAKEIVDDNRHFQRTQPGGLTQYEVDLLMQAGYATIDELLANAAAAIKFAWYEVSDPSVALPWRLYVLDGYDEGSDEGKMILVEKVPVVTE